MSYLITKVILSFFIVTISAATLKSDTTLFECPGLGIYADPDNCQGFYLCSPGLPVPRPNHFLCSNTYLYDEGNQVCNFDYAVDCGMRPRPDQTTTSTSTTMADMTSTITTKSTTTTRMPLTTTTTTKPTTTTTTKPSSTTTTKPTTITTTTTTSSSGTTTATTTTKPTTTTTVTTTTTPKPTTTTTVTTTTTTKPPTTTTVTTTTTTKPTTTTTITTTSSQTTTTIATTSKPTTTTTTKPTTTKSTTTTQSTTKPTTTKETTTTASTGTTTSSISPGGRYPSKVLGLYIILADETVEGYESNANWEPKLYEYQQSGANVLFFTFINPETMDVPLAFQKLAATRGSGGDGAVPKDTKIVFAIGGYSYSLDFNPWKWLTSKEAAEAMATEVATWPDKYGCDGIDLDIEEGAGNDPQAGPNMVLFVKKLRELKPDLIVGQPAYGYPAVPAESEVINASWNVDSTSNNVADSVGLMVYEGTEALRYVDNYAKGAEMWEGFPIRVNVPRNAILLGCKGVTASQSIVTLAQESVRQDLLGVMVWYASVRNGFQYEISWDASTSLESMQAYVTMMSYLNDNMV